MVQYWIDKFFVQGVAGKLAWCLVVGLCFIGAGYLIKKSYSAWQDTPVATSISTHSIADLDFPTVTVCPPKGSHTALNYDLMKADNGSLKEKDRDYLKKEVYVNITEPSHQARVENNFQRIGPWPILS